MPRRYASITVAGSRSAPMARTSLSGHSDGGGSRQRLLPTGACRNIRLLASADAAFRVGTGRNHFAASRGGSVDAHLRQSGRRPAQEIAAVAARRFGQATRFFRGSYIVTGGVAPGACFRVRLTLVICENRRDTPCRQLTQCHQRRLSSTRCSRIRSQPR